MAKLDYEKIFIKDACPTSIGGQAIMEGVMMQGPDRIAIAMRLPSGEFYLKTKKKPAPSKWSKYPLIRGCVNFFNSLIQGTSVLMESADILEKYAPEEYNEDPGKFETWLNKHFSEKAVWNALMTISVVLAFVISIAVFVIFPTFVVDALKHVTKNVVVLNLVEGLFRLGLFILYTFAISKMKDIHTLFQYHGSEHKTIHCFENNLELTPDNAQKFPTLHPRCGTSFLMFVFIIALILFSFFGWPNLGIRIASRLLLLPVIAGVSYELLKWAGRSDGKLVRILSYPGLLLQKLTTAEPTPAQLEVAIISLKAVLVPKDTPVGEGFCDINGEWLSDFREEDFLGDSNDDDNDEPIDISKKTLKNTDVAEFLAQFEAPEFEKIEKKPEDNKSVEAALAWGIDQLRDVDNGKNEARAILCYAAGLSNSELITKAKEVLDDEDFLEYQKRIRTRKEGTPLQYIVGMQQFMGLPFRVNPNVLIPRLDTEVLVENVVNMIKGKNWTNPEVLDMCTGSGAIGVSIADRVPDAIVTMTDISEAALEVAIKNSRLNNVNKRSIFLLGDLFEAIPAGKKYNALIANPPYIETAVIDTLATEVKDHEPRLALDGGATGLDYYKKIIKDAADHIEYGGIIAFEIGDKQAKAVSKLLADTGDYKMITTIKDLAGLDRVVVAERV